MSICLFFRRACARPPPGQKWNHCEREYKLLLGINMSTKRSLHLRPPDWHKFYEGKGGAFTTGGCLRGCLRGSACACARARVCMCAYLMRCVRVCDFRSHRLQESEAGRASKEREATGAVADREAMQVGQQPTAGAQPTRATASTLLSRPYFSSCRKTLLPRLSACQSSFYIPAFHGSYPDDRGIHIYIYIVDVDVDVYFFCLVRQYL